MIPKALLCMMQLILVHSNQGFLRKPTIHSFAILAQHTLHNIKRCEVFVDGIIKSKHKSLTKIHLYLIGAANTVAEFEERYKHIEFVTVKPSLHSSQVPLVMCNYQRVSWRVRQPDE